jgi:hypothetical protein
MTERQLLWRASLHVTGTQKKSPPLSSMKSKPTPIATKAALLSYHTKIKMALLNTILFVFCLCLTSAWSFVPPQQSTMYRATTTSSSSSSSSAMKLMPSTTSFFESSFESSNNLISVATLDPTTVLSDALGGLLGSSAILAVPIVAALSVAGLIAFFIVSYANPEDEDD